jgi:DNA mismatch repair protein MSH2
MWTMMDDFADFQDINSSLGKLQEMVESTIDLAALENHEYIIKPEFDENLQIIKKKLDGVRRKIDAEHRRVGKDLNQEIDKKLMLENNKTHGWCLRLTRTVGICLK